MIVHLRGLPSGYGLMAVAAVLCMWAMAGCSTGAFGGSSGPNAMQDVAHTAADSASDSGADLAADAPPEPDTGPENVGGDGAIAGTDAAAEVATADSADSDAPVEVNAGICKANADCFWYAVEPCQSAVCLAGDCTAVAQDCSDANPCTQDGCAADGSCQHLPLVVACSDGDPCTQGDNCDPWGDCQPGASPCPSMGACSTTICSASPGAPGYTCSYPAKANGSPCSEHPCWTGDFCKGGQCLPGPLPQCDDGRPCTQDSCSAVGSCVHAAAAAGTPYSGGNGMPALFCPAPGSSIPWNFSPWVLSWMVDQPCAEFTGLPSGWSFSSSTPAVIVDGAPHPVSPSAGCVRRIAGAGGPGISTGLCSLESGGCQSYAAHVDGPVIDLSKAAAGVQAGVWLKYLLSVGDLLPPKLAQLQLIDQATGSVLASQALVPTAYGAQISLLAAPAKGGKVIPRVALEMAGSPKPAALGTGLWLLGMTSHVILPAEICGNGVDDNGDGHADCKDWQCYCSEGYQLGSCSDGLDNDADDAIDCADSECAGQSICGKLVYANAMDCGAQGWTALPVQLTSTQASWAIDSVPAGIPLPAGSCALSFDNGVNYNSPGGKSWGAVSLDKGIVVPKGAKLWLQFRAYVDVENEWGSDVLRVALDSEPWGGCGAVPAYQVKECLTKGTPILKGQGQLAKWTTYSLNLTAPAAKVWLRLSFDSVDSNSNTGKGVFIKDLVLHVAP
jgi:hypothetical protein